MALVVALAAVAAPSLAADGAPMRTESRDYALLGPGCANEPMGLYQCFDVLPNEERVRIRAVEESPAASLGRIGGMVYFVDGLGIGISFCDDRTYTIPPGTTSVHVRLNHGFTTECPTTDVPVYDSPFSPAYYGFIEATFFE